MQHYWGQCDLWQRPLSSGELLILHFLVICYFLSLPSSVERTFVYSPRPHTRVWQLRAVYLSIRKKDRKEGCPWERAILRSLFLSAAAVPICSAQAICLVQSFTHPVVSPSINSPGSWEPWPMHCFALYFPSGHRPENDIFFLPFHPFRACPDVLTLFMLSLGQSLSHAPSLKLLQGCSECSRLRCLDSGAARCTPRQALRQPNQWTITCQSQWWMPAPLAVTILGPGACVPSVSWQGLAWSSAHLWTVSNVAHSQLAKTGRRRSEGQEGPSAISASQLLPRFPYSAPPFPNFRNRKGA